MKGGSANTTLNGNRAASRTERRNGMTGRKPLAWRLLAGVGAFALAAAGLMGTATAKADDPVPSPGNIQGTSGSLTVHKHKGDPGAQGPRHDGTKLESAPADPLNGVEFTINRVGNTGVTGQDPINLATYEGWVIARTATPTNVQGGAPWTLGADIVKTTNAGGEAVFDDLPYGLYLVQETNPGSNPIVSPVAPFLVSIPFPSNGNAWTYDVHVYPKNKLNETTPEKIVADPGSQLVVGTVLTYTITAPIPPLATGGSYTKFIISDQLDSRLSIDTTVAGTVVVAVDGVALTAGTDYTVSPAGGTAVAGANVVVTLTADGRGKLAGKTNVVLTLKPTVTSLGVTGVIKNKAVVNVNDTTKETGEPTVNYGSLEVTKVVKDKESETLQGAIFELYDAKNGTRVAGPATTGADGKIKIDGLWVGINADLTQDYWLKEVQAPAGYVTPTGDAAWTQVNIAADATSILVKQQTITNVKHQGPQLPLTGSTGSLVFGIVGLGLIAAAGGTFAVRRARVSR